MFKKFGVLLALVILLSVGWWIAYYFGLLANNNFSQSQSGLNAPELPMMAGIPEPVPTKIETVAEGLAVPWSIVFPTETKMYVSERAGSIRVIENGQLQPQPIFTFDDTTQQDESGLMGLTLDPDYETNHSLYACYTYTNDNQLFDKVVQLTDQEESMQVTTTLLDQIPAANFHAGCRIKFGPDRKLYISTGDARQSNLAQDLSSLAGKILRLNADGSIPADNPFPQSPVYSYGHRNPQGFDWSPTYDVLVETEHGPSVVDGPAGGDEINVVEKGQNYGWPVVSHQQSQEGMISPLKVFTPAIAPASGKFYTSDVLPQYQNTFLVGMLKGEGILQVYFNADDPRQIDYYQKIEGIDFGRIREVTEGPDGYVYFTTSNTDGRGTVQDGDDKVLRIIPNVN